MATRILLRRGTTAQWEADNPVLGSGEPAVEFLTDGSIRLKIGDSVKAWNDLGYNGAEIDLSVIEQLINDLIEDHDEDDDAHEAIREAIEDIVAAGGGISQSAAEGLIDDHDSDPGAHPDILNKIEDASAVNSFTTVPDYVNIVDINRISTNNGTWTVPDDGFVQCLVHAAVGIAGQVIINGAQVRNFTTAESGEFADITVHAVKAGDVVQLRGNPVRQIGCYFIPPRRVWVTAPTAELHTNLLGPPDYTKGIRARHGDQRFLYRSNGGGGHMLQFYEYGYVQITVDGQGIDTCSCTKDPINGICMPGNGSNVDVEWVRWVEDTNEPEGGHWEDVSGCELFEAMCGQRISMMIPVTPNMVLHQRNGPDGIYMFFPPRNVGPEFVVGGDIVGPGTGGDVDAAIIAHDSDAAAHDARFTAQTLALSSHNASVGAHADIRNKITALSDRVDNLDLSGGDSSFLVFETHNLQTGAKTIVNDDHIIIDFAQHEFDENEMFSVSHEGAMVTFLKDQPGIHTLTGIGKDGTHWIFSWSGTTQISIRRGHNLNEKSNVYRKKVGSGDVLYPEMMTHFCQIQKYSQEVLHANTKFVVGVNCSTQDNLPMDIQGTMQWGPSWTYASMNILAAPMVTFDHDRTLAWVAVSNQGGTIWYLCIVPTELFFNESKYSESDNHQRIEWLHEHYIWSIDQGGNQSPPCIWMSAPNECHWRYHENLTLTVQEFHFNNWDNVNREGLLSFIECHMPTVYDYEENIIDVEWLYYNRQVDPDGKDQDHITETEVNDLANQRIDIHNQSTTAHSNIRALITALDQKVENLPTGGFTLHQGATTPAFNFGDVNDWYLNTATRELWQKTGATIWTLRMQSGSTYYGTSITAGGTAAKAVTLAAPVPTNRQAGDIYVVRIGNTNSANAPTLTIGNFANAPIRYNNNNVQFAPQWNANHLGFGDHMFMWDGAGYLWLNYDTIRAQARADAAHTLATNAGGPIHYTTTAQNTGIDWIGGRRIFQRTIGFGANIGATWLSINSLSSAIDADLDQIISAEFHEMAGDTPSTRIGRLRRNGSMLQARMVDGENFNANVNNRITAKYTRVIPVLGIDNVPDHITIPAGASSTTVGLPHSGHIIPNNATNIGITWSLVDTGSAGATVDGSALTVLRPGTCVIQANINDGTRWGTAWGQQYSVTVVGSQTEEFGWELSGDTAYINIHPDGTLAGHPHFDITFDTSNFGTINVVVSANSSNHIPLPSHMDPHPSDELYIAAGSDGMGGWAIYMRSDTDSWWHSLTNWGVYRITVNGVSKDV